MQVQLNLLLLVLILELPLMGGVALGRDSVANVIGGITNKGYNPNTNRTDNYSGLTGNVLTSTTGAVLLVMVLL